MDVRFNGDSIAIPQTQTLEAFLMDRAIKSTTPGIAVALNHQIITRSEWGFRTIVDGDEIEVVHAVQGG